MDRLSCADLHRTFAAPSLGGAFPLGGAEQLLLTKLKTECGYQFTSKLETMFGDIKLSRWVGGGFRECWGAPGTRAVVPEVRAGRHSKRSWVCLWFVVSAPGWLPSLASQPPLPPCREKMADFKAHLERQGKRLDVDMSVQVGAGGGGQAGGAHGQVRLLAGVGLAVRAAAQCARGGVLCRCPAATALRLGKQRSRRADKVTSACPAPPRRQVLTSGMWPQTTAAPTCNLPRELEQCTREFVAYYLHANSGGAGCADALRSRCDASRCCSHEPDTSWL